MKPENRSSCCLLLTLVTASIALLAGCELGKPSKPTVDTSDRPSASCGDCTPAEACVDGECKCVPECKGKPCGGDDSCGGSCACEGDLVKNAQGDLVPAAQCHDTCESAAWACGELCGHNCGGCEEGKVCGLTGQCECIPRCDGSSCADGCGGSCECAAGSVCDAKDRCVAPAACHDSCASTKRTCGAVCGNACGACDGGESCLEHSCAAAITCETCMLNAKLIERKVESGMLREITIAIEYAPGKSAAVARIADVRIRANRPVELVAAEPGPALTESGRSLYVDQETGRTWQKLSNGSYQLLAYGFGGTNGFVPGRVAMLKFTTSDPGPIAFSFDRRAQTLAPADADAELQASTYEHALVVSQ